MAIGIESRIDIEAIKTIKTLMGTPIEIVNTIAKDLGIHESNLRDYLKGKNFTVLKNITRVSLAEDPDPAVSKFAYTVDVDYWCDGCGIAIIGDCPAVDCLFCDESWTLCVECSECEPPPCTECEE